MVVPSRFPAVTLAPKKLNPKFLNRPKNDLKIQVFGHCLENDAPIRLYNRKGKNNLWFTVQIKARIIKWTPRAAVIVDIVGIGF